MAIAIPWPRVTHIPASCEPKKPGGEDKLAVLEQNLDDVFSKRRSTIFVLPGIDLQVLQTAQKLRGCLIGGGAALALYTGELQHIKDWDLFFASRADLEYARQTFLDMGFSDEVETPMSYTFTKAGVIIQLVHKYFVSSPEELFAWFDITTCCFAIDGDMICYTKQARRDVKDKVLNFNYVDNIVSTVKRIARYGVKGYTPSYEFVKDLVVFAQTLDPSNIEAGGPS